MKDDVTYIAPIYSLSRVDPSTAPAKISYSQWAMYEKCPKQWELSYIKKLAPFTNSIETTFGTAFHETMQEYITVLLTKGVKQADWINFRQSLTDRLKSEYVKSVEQNGSHFSTPAELGEYLEDGVAILEWFQKRRREYFSTKNTELIGVEMDLCVPASEKNPAVYWYGFIDLVILDTSTNTLYIYDIKTSRNGWNKYQKADKLKLSQLVAYKTYFAKQYGVPVDNIEVEFFIVRRKLVEESMFPQKRVQQVRPASGSVTRKQIQKKIDQFVEECFDADGNRIESKPYMARSGKGDKNCRYCPFKTDYVNCPRENRIRI
jgi:hypothetical protein